jgi:hypothetical protein
MPKASKESASQTEALEGFEGHYEQFEGGYTARRTRRMPTCPRSSRACRPTAARLRTGAT